MRILTATMITTALLIPFQSHSTGSSGGQETIPNTTSACEITLFNHEGLYGEHQHVFNSVEDLGRTNLVPVEDIPNATFLNNRVSSFVIHSGCWIFYAGTFFEHQLNHEPLLPGIYNRVIDFLGSGSNDRISSLRCYCDLPEDAHSERWYDSD